MALLKSWRWDASGEEGKVLPAEMWLNVSANGGSPVMPFNVLLTNDAAQDLDELYDYIARHDASRKADYVLEQIEKAFSKLSEFPERVLTLTSC